MNYIKFSVIREHKLMVGISDVMSRMDLGISKVTQPITEIWSWKTTTKIGKAYIDTAEKMIRKAIEDDGGECLGIKFIEKGKVDD